MKSVLIIGIGNVLMMDDAIGPAAIAALEAGWDMPAGVSVEDAGTPGVDLTGVIAGAERLIVIDAARTSDPPGTVRVWEGAEILAITEARPVTPHDPGLRDALLTLEATGELPHTIRLIGVTPGRVGTGTGLTPAVEAAVAIAVQRAIALLEALGLAPTPRANPRPAARWWEDSLARDP